MPRTFNIDRALEMGYTYNDMVDYLGAKNPKFDVFKAKGHLIGAQGFQPEEATMEVARYLAKQPLADSEISAPGETGLPGNVSQWGRENPNKFAATEMIRDPLGGVRSTLSKVGDFIGKEPVAPLETIIPKVDMRPAIQEGAETVGLLGGGAAATLAAPLITPAGAAAIAPFTAGAGYAAGKEGGRLLNKGLDLGRPGPSQISGPETDLREDAKATLGDLSTGAQIWMGGELAGFPVRTALQPIKESIEAGKKTAEVAAAIQEANDLFRNAKIRFEGLPADLTKAKKAEFGEYIMRVGFLSADILKDAQLQKKIYPLLQARSILIDKGKGTSQDEIKTLGESIKNKVTQFLKEQGPLEEEALNGLRRQVLTDLGVGELAAEEMTPGLYRTMEEQSIRAAREKTNLYTRIGDTIQRTPEGLERAFVMDDPQMPSNVVSMANVVHSEWMAQGEASYPAVIKKHVEWFLNGEPKTWSQLQKRVEMLNADIVRENPMVKTSGPGGRGASTPEGRDLYRFKAALVGNPQEGLSGDLENIARFSENPETLNAWNIARAHYENVFAPVWKSEKIKQMFRSSPATFVNTAFTPGDIQGVDVVKRAFGEDLYNSEVKPTLIAKLMGSGHGEVFNPKTLAAEIKKYGDPMLEYALSRSTLNQLKQAATGEIQIGKFVYDPQILKNIVKEDVTGTVESIVGSVERRQSSRNVARNLRNLEPFLTPEEKTSLGNNLIQRIMSDPKSEYGITPSKFVDTFNKFSLVLKEFFPEKQPYLKKLSDMAQHFTRGETILSPTTAALPAWGQAMTIMGGAFGTAYDLTMAEDKLHWQNFKWLMIGGGMIVGPRELAKLYVSPAGLKWLTQAIEPGTGKYAFMKRLEASTKVIGVLSMSDEEAAAPGKNDPLGLRKAWMRVPEEE